MSVQPAVHVGTGAVTAPIAVLGAGIAGLTAASELRRRGLPVRVYEAGREIAGMGRSFKDERGFTYDFGAHLITNRFAAALGVAGNCETVTRYDEGVCIGGHTYSFPFGLLRSPRFVMSAAASRIVRRNNSKDASAADWYRANYGSVMADHVAIPLVEAWSGVSADQLSSAVIPPHVDRGTINVLKLKLSGWASGRAVANGYSREKPESAHVWHVYPKGGVVELCNSLASGLSGHISVETRVEAIRVEGDRVRSVRVNGKDEEVSAVVSTAPLHILPKLIEGSNALDHLRRFRYRPMVLVNLRFRGRPMLPAVTTWVPEREYPFFRLTEVPQSVPWLAPEGMTMVTADIGCEVDSDHYKMEEDALGELCVGHLDRLFPGARSRYEGSKAVRTPIGYPVYLREYEHERRALEGGLPIKGLYSVGRNGEFAHILMEDIYWRTLSRMRDLRLWIDREASGGRVA
jgi:protoporphyrinogen/coproporphyrinogen III oxidase